MRIADDQGIAVRSSLKWGQVLNLDFSLITPGFHEPNTSVELFLLFKLVAALFIVSEYLNPVIKPVKHVAP